MSTIQNPTWTHEGVTLPIPGTWVLDPGHAEVSFIGRHFLLTKVRGRFRSVEASAHLATDPRDTWVEATIDMASVDSGDDTRDTHLRSADLFDVERFPQARFRSTSVRWDAQTGQMTGDLTIRDVTRPVTLDVEFVGALTDPWGNDRAVFSARTAIDREDWGLTWNMVLDTGGLLVSKQIEIELHVELVRAEAVS